MNDPYMEEQAKKALEITTRIIKGESKLTDDLYQEIPRPISNVGEKNDDVKVDEDLKFIQKELHEGYEIHDKILIGYAINRLDTYIFEMSKKDQERLPNHPSFSNVIDRLQEKKKIWETILKSDEITRDYHSQNKEIYNYYDGCVSRVKTIIEDLQEIIDQNSIIINR